MIKITVWDMLEERFSSEEFVVKTNNFQDAAIAYCKHAGTLIKKRDGGVFTLINLKMLDLTKISKYRTTGYTEI